MIEKSKNYLMNFHIIARYAVPLMLALGTISVGLRLFHFDDASSIAMLIAIVVLGLLLVSPIIALLFPKVKLNGKPIGDTEWIIYLLWIVILISIKIWIKASSY
jgi:hypothetical protein